MQTAAVDPPVSQTPMSNGADTPNSMCLVSMTGVKKRGLGLRTTILTTPLYHCSPDAQNKLLLSICDCLNISGPSLASYVEAHHSVKKNQMIVETEFFGRGSLRNKIDAYLKHGMAFQEPEIWSMAAQIVQCLCYLHSPFPFKRGRTGLILHLGISPESIMVYNTAEYKLSAYGIRQFLLRAASTHHKALISAETDRVRLYMAPELRRAMHGCTCQPSTKCDIWSLGVVLLELVSLAACCNNSSIATSSTSSQKVLPVDSFTPMVPSQTFAQKPVYAHIDEASDKPDTPTTTDCDVEILTDQMSSASSTTSNLKWHNLYRAPHLFLEELFERRTHTPYSDNLFAFIRECIHENPAERSSAIFLLRHPRIQEAIQRIEQQRIEASLVFAHALQTNDMAMLQSVISSFDRAASQIMSNILSTRSLQYIQCFAERIAMKNLLVTIPVVYGRPVYAHTELMKAAESGDALRVTECLERDLGCVYGGCDSGTALMISAREGNTECARLLLAETGIVAKNGVTALMYAAQNGHLAVAQLLLCESRKQTSIGETALMHAVQNGYVHIVSLLAAREARIQRNDGATALMIAAKLGRERCVAILMHYEHGMRNKAGETALEFAISYRHGSCAEILLECEAHLAASDGASSLQLAVRNGVVKVVPQLLRLSGSMESSYFLKMIRILVLDKGADRYLDMIKAYIEVEKRTTLANKRQQDVDKAIYSIYADAFCWALNLLRPDCALSALVLSDKEIPENFTDATQYDRQWFPVLMSYMDRHGINCQLLETLLNYFIWRQNHGMVRKLTQFMADRPETVVLNVWKRCGNRVSSRTALMECAERGDTKGVAENIKEVGSICGNDTALLLATRNRHIDCIKLLLCEQGIAGPDCVTALMVASCNNDVEAVKLLLAEVFRYDEDGTSSMMLAAEAGNVECVKLLSGRCKGWQDHTGRTALIRAAESCRINVISFLIDEIGIGGITDLMVSAVLNDMDGVKKHMEYLGAQTCCGWTALMFAAKAGHADCVARLLKEATKYNNEHYTAMMLAAEQGHTDCVRLLFSLEHMQRGPNGWTALMVAAQGGNAECVQAILNMSTPEAAALASVGEAPEMEGENDVDIKNPQACIGLQAYDGRTALMLAAAQGHAACVELLLEREKRQTDIIGEFALLKAVLWGNIDCVKLLYKYEGDLKDRNGQTALDLATNILSRKSDDNIAQECISILTQFT